jgi:MoaA/NifB/PqqE/SkfB family radical SAM enzyme
MRQSVRNYWINVGKLLRGDRLLRPLVVTYYVTTHCNLGCAYCEDFGSHHNDTATPPLDLPDAVRVLQVIRQATDCLILTGGEPLLYPDIARLAATAKHELGFRSITVLTNGSMLNQSQDLLPLLDRLVVSLDTTDPGDASRISGAPITVSNRILDNIRACADRQLEKDFQMVLNCVLTPESLPGAQRVLEFGVENGLLVSFSPQAVHNWPHYDLLVSSDYHAFLSQLVCYKRKGAPILGSETYLRTMSQMTPYSCYPTLVPRVMPNGDLLYPCRPIENENGSHGGRASNLLRTPNWEQAMDSAVERYGKPPRICTSCFQQCFAEPSLMQTRPFALLKEMLRYPASRRGTVWTHAPG